MIKVLQIFESHGIRAFPAKIYGSQDLTRLEWTLHNFPIPTSQVSEIYEHDNRSINFKISNYNKKS